MLPQIAGAIRSVEQLFREEWTTSAEVYLPVVEPGTLARNRALAATYRRVIAEAEAHAADREEQIEAAHDAWYRGFVAEAMIDFSKKTWLDSSGEPHSGLLAEDDLRDWRPRYEQPLAVDYHGADGLQAGPWSQAPVFLQQLRLLEGFDLAALGQRLGGVRPHDHRMREARVRRSRGVVRRSRLLRRPDRALLSREYADERRALIGDEASAELAPARRTAAQPRLAPPPAAPRSTRRPASASRPGRRERRHRAPRCRRPLRQHGRGDAERRLACRRAGRARARLLPRHARADVLARGGPAELARAGQAAANDALADAGRCATASPTSRSARPAATSRISGRCTLLLGHLHFGLDLQAAIDAPNHPHRAFPSSFYPRETRPRRRRCRGSRWRADDRRPAEPRPRRRGRAAWSLGRVSAAGRERDGVLKAAADPRGDRATPPGARPRQSPQPPRLRRPRRRHPRPARARRRPRRAAAPGRSLRRC